MQSRRSVQQLMRPPSGLIGRRHTQHAFDEPRVHLTCIIDPTTSGEDFAAQKNLRLFKSVDLMLSARAAGLVQVDAAIVAVRGMLFLQTVVELGLIDSLQTPNSTHVPLGLLLVQAGIHVLIEKPFSTDVASGRQLIAKEHASSARILVGHHRRFVSEP